MSAWKVIVAFALPSAPRSKAVSVSAKVHSPVLFHWPWDSVVALFGEVKLTVPSKGPPV
jgi:hypothetical protein